MDTLLNKFKLVKDNRVEDVELIDFENKKVNNYSYPDENILVLRSLNKEDKAKTELFVGDIVKTIIDEDMLRILKKNVKDKYFKKIEEFGAECLYVLITHFPKHLSNEGILYDIYMGSGTKVELLFGNIQNSFGVYLCGKGVKCGSYYENSNLPEGIEITNATLKEEFLDKALIFDSRLGEMNTLKVVDYTKDLINGKYTNTKTDYKIKAVRELEIKNNKMKVGDILRLNVIDNKKFLESKLSESALKTLEGAKYLYFVIGHYTHCYAGERLNITCYLDTMAQDDGIDIAYNIELGRLSKKFIEDCIDDCKYICNVYMDNYKEFLIPMEVILDDCYRFEVTNY